MCLCKWEEELLEHLIPAIRHHRSVGYMNAAQIKRTESVLMKSTLPEQTCQALIQRQLNAVLKQ